MRKDLKICEFFIRKCLLFVTCDCCPGLVGTDDTPDGSVDHNSVRLDLVRRVRVRRIPADDQGLVEVRLQGELLWRRDPLLGDATGVSFLILSVVKVCSEREI